jgi:hypothetical protein
MITPIERNKPIVWIPSLGFKPRFTFKLWQNINSLKIEIIKPIIGFPAFGPDYYDRALIEHAKSFENNDQMFTKGLKYPMYSPSNNPFQTYSSLKNQKDTFIDYSIVFSPLGPKPICLGMVLTAILKGISIYFLQAKSYYPDYSFGESTTWSYWIRNKSEYTFEID